MDDVWGGRHSVSKVRQPVRSTIFHFACEMRVLLAEAKAKANCSRSRMRGKNTKNSNKNYDHFNLRRVFVFWPTIVMMMMMAMGMALRCQRQASRYRITKSCVAHTRRAPINNKIQMFCGATQNKSPNCIFEAQLNQRRLHHFAQERFA